MSSHFSANQYDGSFKPVKLQNWQVPMSHKERPDTQVGFTEIIANGRGHLISDDLRKEKSPWDTGYVNAWSMPRKIPGNCITVKTARSTYAQEKLQMEYERETSAGKNKKNKDKACAPPPPEETSPAPPVDDDASHIRTPSAADRRTPSLSGSPVPDRLSPCPVHGEKTARSPLGTPQPSTGRRTATPKTPTRLAAV